MSLNAHVLALPDDRARLWLEMTTGKRIIGRIRSRADGKRWYIDFGRKWPSRFIYSFRGAAFKTEDSARLFLAGIHMEISKSRRLEDVLSEFAPLSSKSSLVETLVADWLELFERKVKTDQRGERTLKMYKRWANADTEFGYFGFWYGRSIFEVDSPLLEEWECVLAEVPLRGKTRHNVFAGFHAFLSYAASRLRSFEIPQPYPWPVKEEHIPTVLSMDVRGRVLGEIKESKRGVFLGLAWLGCRPTEARVLRVSAWDGADEIRITEAARDDRIQPHSGTKGLKHRASGGKVLPVAPELREWLEKYVPLRRRMEDPDGPLFVNTDPQSKTGWWSKSGLSRVWANACGRAGVKVSLYEGTKHSLGTALKAAQVDDRTIAKLFGHADQRSVAVYAKVDTSTVRSALGRLERRGGE